MLGTMHMALCTGPGCLAVRPEPRAGGMPASADDPRMRVARVAAGEAAPFAGIVVNDWTWEQMLAALRRAPRGAAEAHSAGREAVHE